MLPPQAFSFANCRFLLERLIEIVLDMRYNNNIMMHLRKVTTLILLAALMVGGSFLLLRIGSEVWIPTPIEILASEPHEAVYGSVWLLLLVMMGWLIVSVLLAVCAYTVQIPAAIRTVEWMTVRPVRRLAQRMAALILAVGSVFGGHPVGAAHPPPIPVVASSEEVPDSHTGLEQSGVFVPRPTVGIVAGSPVSSAAYESGKRTGVSTPKAVRIGAPEVTREQEYDTHVVLPGDSMWSISTAHVHRSRPDEVTDSDIFRVWRQMVDLNRHRIRSGDPDLIFPGELLLLPELTRTDEQ